MTLWCLRTFSNTIKPTVSNGSISIKIQAFKVDDLTSSRKCDTDDFSSCHTGGNIFRGGDHAFKITSAPNSNVKVKVTYNAIEVGDHSGSQDTDDCDFNANVEFYQGSKLLYRFERIKFHNSKSTETEFSILMFKDESTRMQENHDGVLFTSDETNVGDVDLFTFTIPSDDTIVGISFTRREQ